MSFSIGLASTDVTARAGGIETHWNLATGSKLRKRPIQRHAGRQDVHLPALFSSLTRSNKFWQPFDSLVPHNLNRNWGFCKIRVEFGDVSDRADVVWSRQVLIFVHGPAQKSFDVEVHDESVFVSLFRGCSLSSGPQKRAIKKSSTRRTDQGNEMLGLNVFVEAAMLGCATAIRLDQGRGTGT